MDVWLSSAAFTVEDIIECGPGCVFEVQILPLPPPYSLSVPAGEPVAVWKAKVGNTASRLRFPNPTCYVETRVSGWKGRRLWILDQ